MRVCFKNLPKYASRPTRHRATQATLLSRASVGDVRRRDGAHRGDLHRFDGDPPPVEMKKFDLIGRPIPVDVHDPPHISRLQVLLGEVLRQDDSVVLLNHCTFSIESTGCTLANRGSGVNLETLHCRLIHVDGLLRHLFFRKESTSPVFRSLSHVLPKRFIF